jgi:hypothetical protein
MFIDVLQRAQSPCSLGRQPFKCGSHSNGSLAPFKANPENVLLRRTAYDERALSSATSMQWGSASAATPDSSNALLRIAGVFVAGLAIAALTVSRRSVGGNLIVPTRQTIQATRSSLRKL